MTSQNRRPTMKDNQAKYPQLRFKGFTDPWVQRQVGDFLTESRIPGSNGAISKKLTVKLWGKGVIPKETVTDGSEATKYYVRKAGQFMYGKLDFLHAAFGIVPENLDGYESTLDSPAFDIANLNSTFLMDTVMRKSFYLYQGNIANGSRKAKRIHVDTFSDMPIDVPTLDEQDKIGYFFDQLDNLIAANQRKLDLLKEQKKGYLQKMFPKNGSKFPQLRFSGFADAWEQRKLGKMGYTFTGLSGKTKEDFGHGNAKFVTYMNVFSSPVSNSEMVENVEVDSKQHQVEYGDVFFTTSSETPQEVGMSSVWLETAENIYLNSFCFGYHPMVEFDPYYLAFMLRSPVIRKKFMLLAQGISRYNISKNKVMEMLVPVPEIVEQQKIGSFFKQLDDTITLHQRKLEKLQELKKGYLQKMFC